MKAKQLFLAIAVLLAVAGLWFAKSTSRAPAISKSNVGVDFKNQNRPPQPGQISNPPPRLAPPDPSRRFREFTPEQRVEFARKGHGPGG